MSEDTFSFEEAAGDTATADEPKGETFSFEDAQQSRPLPSGVKPSEAGAGRGTGSAFGAKTPNPVLADIRANTEARNIRVGTAQSGQKSLPADVPESEADAGRGFMTPTDDGLNASKQPLTMRQLGRDLKGGIEDTKGLVRAAGAFGGAADYRATADALTDFDAIDAGQAPTATGSKPMRTNGPSTTVEPGPVAKAYQAADPEQRAKLRTNALQALTRDQQFVDDSAKAIKAYSDEKKRLSGNIPEFTDIESVRDFGTWLARTGVSSAPTMAVAMVAASLGGVPGFLVGSGGMALGDLTQARIEDATATTDPKRFTSADRAAEANDVRAQKLVEKVGQSTGTTAVLAVPYAALDMLGPVGKALKGVSEEVKRKTIRAILAHGAKELPVQMVEEFANEGGQEVVNVLGDILANERPSDWTAADAKRIFNSAMSGVAMAPGGHAANIGHEVYAAARDQGFHVKMPLTNDTPDVQRSKTVAIFTALAAKYGVDPDAVKRATETASTMPAEDVGPFLKRLTDAYQKRGLVAKPVDEFAADTLTAGPVEDPKAIVQREKVGQKLDAEVQAEAEKKAEEAAKAKKEGKTTESRAPVSDTNTPVSRGTPVEEDLSGLSEPARPSVIDQIATEGATHPTNDLPEPTQPQKEAENYKVGHDNTTIPGERLSIENGAGSTRKGVSPEGKAWSTDMQDHYGRILGTVGMDSTPEKPQHVDFFAKSGTPESHAGPVFVVDQVDPKTGKPDEHKVMFGYDSIAQAKKAYLAHYEKGWKGLGAITETSLDAFKTWVHSDATSKPFAPSAAAREAAPALAPSAAAPHVIARVGPAPSHAQPLELRPNENGSSGVWHDGHEVLDFETAKPVQIPKGTSDADALQIVKDSGAFGRRAKYFAPKGDTEVAPIEKPAKPKPSTPGTAVSDEFLARKRAEASKAEAKAEVAAAPAPEPAQAPKPRKLSDKQAFASDYAHFAGRDLQQSVQLSDTGETATITMPANRAMRTLDARLQALTDLKACIGRHA